MLMLCSAALADGRWADRQFAFRRGINVNWDAQHGSDRELAEVIFLTAGQVNPDGTDLRVATQDGKPVPSQVLMVGPGDLARVAFSLVPGVHDYQVYFGNPHPAAGQAPDFKFTCGLLLETKLYSGGPTATPQDLQSSWDDGGPLIGRELIDLPFLEAIPSAISRAPSPNTPARFPRPWMANTPWRHPSTPAALFSSTAARS